MANTTPEVPWPAKEHRRAVPRPPPPLLPLSVGGRHGVGIRTQPYVCSCEAALGPAQQHLKGSHCCRRRLGEKVSEHTEHTSALSPTGPSSGQRVVFGLRCKSAQFNTGNPFSRGSSGVSTGTHGKMCHGGASDE